MSNIGADLGDWQGQYSQRFIDITRMLPDGLAPNVAVVRDLVGTGEPKKWCLFGDVKAVVDEIRRNYGNLTDRQVQELIGAYNVYSKVLETFRFDRLKSLNIGDTVPNWDSNPAAVLAVRDAARRFVEQATEMAQQDTRTGPVLGLLAWRGYQYLQAVAICAEADARARGNERNFSDPELLAGRLRADMKQPWEAPEIPDVLDGKVSIGGLRMPPLPDVPDGGSATINPASTSSNSFSSRSNGQRAPGTPDGVPVPDRSTTLLGSGQPDIPGGSAENPFSTSTTTSGQPEVRTEPPEIKVEPPEIERPRD